MKAVFLFQSVFPLQDLGKKQKHFFFRILTLRVLKQNVCGLPYKTFPLMLGLHVFEMRESVEAASGSLHCGQCNRPHSVMSVQQSLVRRIVESSSFLDWFLYLNIKLFSPYFYIVYLPNINFINSSYSPRISHL